MLLLTAVALGVLLGLARGGRLRNIAGLPLRSAWLPLTLFALQVVLVQSGLIETGSGWDPAAAFLVASYAVLIGFLVVNRALPGVKLIVLGAALNLAVILANGGYMPITMEALERAGHADRVVIRGQQPYVSGSKDVVLDRDATRLYPLSDILGIPSGYPLPTNFSVGDVAIAFGAAMLAYRSVRKSSRTTSEDAGQWTTAGQAGPDTARRV